LLHAARQPASQPSLPNIAVIAGGDLHGETRGHSAGGGRRQQLPQTSLNTERIDSHFVPTIDTNPADEIVCHKRLGGLLKNHQRRNAA